MSDGQRRPENVLGIEPGQVERLLDNMKLQRDLSLRERQVAVSCARGLDTKATAAELGLSPKTIDEIWRRLYLKFGCRSRVEVHSRILAAALIRAQRST
jgi:DNA-binding NarL/FixJ family response regulator